MKMRDADAHRGLVNVGDAWYCESAMSLTWELPAPRIVALSTHSRVVRKRLLRATAFPNQEEDAMEQFIAGCAGLDVHKETVVVCVRVPGPGQERRQHVCTFETMAAGLPALRAALAGRFRGHHGFLVGELLAHLDYLEEAIERLSRQIEDHLRPFAPLVQPLDAIPGVNQRAIEGIVAEIGVDMRPFPTAAHLVSWAGICPGHHESAGKHNSGKTRKGNRWLRTALIEAALGAIRTKDCRLAARYRRIMRHRGHKKAVVAVAHTILVIIYHRLTPQVPYQEVGAAYLDQRDREQATRRYVKQLERLGHRVVLALPSHCGAAD